MIAGNKLQYDEMAVIQPDDTGVLNKTIYKLRQWCNG
jgi:hypothetical protein